MADPIMHSKDAPTVALPFPRAPKYETTERAAVLGLLSAERLSDTGRGPAIAGVENAFAALTQTRYALSFNSGTGSLHAALRAVDVVPDAGVVVSPMTWISGILVTFHAGSYPIVRDLEPGTVNLDPLAATTAPNASAILVTHAWGIPARMDIYTRHATVPVVEDCSHAHGARYAGRPVGSWGAAGCFSLMERKPVSGGEGGILTTNHRRVYEQAMLLGHHPHRLAAELTDPALLALAGTGLGYKLRMPAMAAAIAHANLQRLAERMVAAEANLARLRDALAAADAPVAVPHLVPGTTRGWYGTPVTVTRPVTDPDGLTSACAAARVPVRRHYDDWLLSPLLRDRALLCRHFPHLRHTPYTPPDPDAFPHYATTRRQTLLVKIPDVPAPAYIDQVAVALAHILDRF